ncbi:hypothetical protein DWB61_09755 [Ancylomarina euxinus]|uniref:Tail specific protease domain-containing protein n=1 Tax=Ancylomarina euxinus TaxID=2283627 RepID=A0A425Y0Z5_9BACT|nr:S41 family peptidase [Ancylomarina euxinus]MCZ4693787.1 S41 family peptidase [Ancylomarina euxinus]MUP15133.1 hypothetical protein [Ancylomarina euxinus]RRG21556.1 hypothetical protein DWB61_09755 [Ancylomarina euxinus]
MKNLRKMKSLLLIIVMLIAFNTIANSKEINEKFNSENRKCEKQSITLNGSDFEFNEININRLFKLGKLWGFLKYYHPFVRSGKIDWDQELLMKIELVFQDDFDNEILEWVQNVGNKESENKYKRCDKNQGVTDWFREDSFQDSTLMNELDYLMQKKRKRNSHYVSLSKKKRIQFINEVKYPNIDYTDASMKILSLFRYWNYVEYFFAYKHLLKKDWDEIFIQYIPKIVKCDDELTYKLTMLSLFGELNDTHSTISPFDKTINTFFGEFIAPLRIEMIENVPVVTGIPDNYQIYNINVGDIITQIDYEDVAELIKNKIKYCPASNDSRMIADVTALLLRSNKSKINLKLDTDNGSFIEEIHTIKYRPGIVQKIDNTNKLFDDSIAYINTGSLKPGQLELISKEILSKKGVIVDLRCYPGDNLINKLGNLIVCDRKAFARCSWSNAKNPGYFTSSMLTYVGGSKQNYYKGKVMILINSETHSFAEYTAMALQLGPNTTIIGSTTSGADGDIVSMILPGNIQTWFSSIRITYPNGKECQQVGIIPDVRIKPTIEGIRAGKDELIEKAIELINMD